MKLSRVVPMILIIVMVSADCAGQDKTSGLFAAFNRHASASQAALGASLLSSGSAAVIFFNPAGMQYLENTQASFTYLKLNPDLDQKFMTFALSKHLGSNFSIGLGGMSHSVGGIEGYNSSAEFTQMYKVNEWLGMLALSTDMIAPFGIGVNIKAASLKIAGSEGISATGFGFDYGIVYQQSQWFLISVSAQSAFKLNENEMSLPRIRSSMEFDIPFFWENRGGTFQLAATTQTEYGHWTTGFLGLHSSFPIVSGIKGYLNGRTPGQLLLTNSGTLAEQEFEPPDKWGIGGGITIDIGMDVKMKMEIAYLDEKYFDQLITTIEFIY